MPIKTFITAEEFAALPPKIEIPREQLYSQAEGGHVLAAEAAAGFKVGNFAKMEQALNSERELSKSHAAKLKAWDGLEPDVVRSSLSQLDEWKKSDPGEKARKAYEAEMVKVEAAHNKSLSEIEAKRTKLQKQLESQAVASRVRDAMAKHGANKLLEPHIATRLRTEVTDDGDVSIYVTDERGSKAEQWDGQRMVPMSVDAFVESLKTNPEFAPGFKGSGATGSGATSSASSKSSPGAFTMTAAQAKDAAAYQRLSEAAAKSGQRVTIVG